MSVHPPAFSSSSLAQLIPVVAVTRDSASLAFRCPYCRRTHWHSAHSTWCAPGCPCAYHRGASSGPCSCPAGSGDGHRAAHCNTDTPYRRTGYVIREVAQ